MSRTMEEIQQDYGRSAAELGDLNYKRKLSEDNIEKLDYGIQKLLNKMDSLGQEAKKLAEELEAKKNEVKLPEVSDEQS